MLFEQLLSSLNNPYLTTVMMLSFHLAILSCSTHTIGFYLICLYILTFIIKLTRFHFFMKKRERHTQDGEFQRDALVLSCLSLFLEVFGHIFISLISGLGYVVYTMQKRFMLLIIGLVLACDASRNFVNQCKGNRPFAQYIAP